jgi:hypothetical protein
MMQRTFSLRQQLADFDPASVQAPACAAEQMENKNSGQNCWDSPPPLLLQYQWDTGFG